MARSRKQLRETVESRVQAAIAELRALHCLGERVQKAHEKAKNRTSLITEALNKQMQDENVSRDRLK